MDNENEIDTLLDELYEFGKRHGGMWNIGPQGGALLAWLVGLCGAQRALEIGTSNGYSAIWLARALAVRGGSLVTLEVDPVKAEMARANLKRSELHDSVTIVEGPALASVQVLGGPFDLVFIDADKSKYVDYLRAARRLVRPGSIIAADNITSHPDDTEPYRALVDADDGLDSVLLPVGGGLYLSRVRGDRALVM